MKRNLYVLFAAVALVLAALVALTTISLGQKVIVKQNQPSSPSIPDSPVDRPSYFVFLPTIATSGFDTSPSDLLSYPPISWPGIPNDLLSMDEIGQLQPPPQDTSDLDSKFKAELSKIESSAAAKGLQIQTAPRDKLDAGMSLENSLTVDQRKAIGEVFAQHEQALRVLIAPVEAVLKSQGKPDEASSVKGEPKENQALSLDAAREIASGLQSWQTALDVDMKNVLTEEQWAQYQASRPSAPLTDVSNADLTALGLVPANGNQPSSAATNSSNAYYAYLHSYYAYIYEYYGYAYAYYGYTSSYCSGTNWAYWAYVYAYYGYYYGYYAYVWDYYSYIYWPNSSNSYYAYVYSYYSFINSYYGYIYSYYAINSCNDYYGYLYYSYVYNYYASANSYYAYYFSYYAYLDSLHSAPIDYHTRDGFYVFKIDMRNTSFTFETVMANDASSGYPDNKEYVSDMVSRYANAGRNPVLAFNADYFGVGHGAEGLTVKNGTRILNAGSHAGAEFKRSSLSISSARTLRAGIQTDCKGPPDNNCTSWKPNSSSYYNTVGGGPLFVSGSKRLGGTNSIVPCRDEGFGDRFCNGTFNWTAVGISQDGNYLIVVISAVAKSMDQAAAVLIAEGADRAIKLDSGSSTQVWYKPKGSLVTGAKVANALMIFSSQ